MVHTSPFIVVLLGMFTITALCSQKEFKCAKVCQDLPKSDRLPVCMMFSRYKRGYQYFVNLCHARRSICQDNLELTAVIALVINDSDSEYNNKLKQIEAKGDENANNIIVFCEVKMDDFLHKIRRDKNVNLLLSDTKLVCKNSDPEQVPVQRTVKTYQGRCATFQASMKLTIIIGQCFGLNPVLGVTNIDTSKLRFTIFSGRFVYSLLSVVGQTVMLALGLLKFIKDTNTSLSSKTSLVFYTTNTITTVLFIQMATKWPKLCEHISRTEATDPNMDTSLITRCNVYCIVILSLAFGEHALSDLAGIVLVVDCQPYNKQIEIFNMASFPWVFEFITYNHFLGFLAQLINIQCTFNWNFSDIFVICISLYLTSRLEQVNKKIVAVKGKYVQSAVWRALREDYNRVTSLVRRVDDVIGSIVFISFANNLFFICLQMLHTLADGVKPTPSCQDPDIRPFRGLEHPTYFLYSLIFLMARSLVVSLIAARVHTASRQPLYSLYEVPSAVYCVEIQRFAEQIHGETVALSGLQFFKIKRGLVLAIAGTIATYELVLLQFAGVTPTVTPSETVI